MVDALKRFHQVADRPLDSIAELAKAGKKPLGYFSNYFPIELAMAAGYTPVRLLGFPAGLSRADAHLQSYCCSIARTTLEVGLSGDLNDLEGLVFTHTCDTLQRLAEIWYANRIHGFTHVLNFPTDLSTTAAFDFYMVEMNRLRKTLAVRSGSEVSDDSLAAAIETSRRMHSIYAELAKLLGERRGGYGFADLQSATYAGYMMDREQWTELAGQAVAELKTLETKSGPRLAIYGGVFHNRAIGKVIDDAKVQVVADLLGNVSHDWLPMPANGGDPLKSLARNYFDRPTDSTKLREGESKSDRVVAMAKDSGAKGVLIMLVKFCEPNAFDYPHIKKALEANEIPHLFLEHDVWEGGIGQMSTRLEAFIEILNG